MSEKRSSRRIPVAGGTRSRTEETTDERTGETPGEWWVWIATADPAFYLKDEPAGAGPRKGRPI